MPIGTYCSTLGLIKKKMRITITLAIAIIMVGCGQNKKQATVDKMNEKNSIDAIKIDTSMIAVIPFDTTYHWLFENARPSELDQTELKQIEKIITDCIAEYNPEQRQKFDEISKKYPNDNCRLSDFIIELNRYKRQYVPVINGLGEKEIWVNCFCSTWDSNWRTEILEVFDGGNCYFQLKINLTKNEFYNFMVNGVA